MTEAEWEASEDPGAMLRYLQEGCGVCDGTGSLGGSESPKRPCDLCGGRQPAKPSDRKLRLFVAAGLRVVIPESPLVPTVEAMADNLAIPEDRRWWPTIADVGSSARTLVNTQDPFARPMLAHLLREIVGNPFRPVTLTRTVECDRCNGKGQRTIGSKCGSCEGTGKTKGNADWLTPTVRSLAQAAYDERAGRQCGDCWNRLRSAASLMSGPNPGDGRGSRCEAVAEKMRRCPKCQGTSRIEDGTLDPARLAVLADALEEAGCESETKQPVLMAQSCLQCGQRTRQAGEGYRPEARYCDPCARIWVSGEHYLWPAPHPILAHLRSPGPHVRGCWAIDLLTGRE